MAAQREGGRGAVDAPKGATGSEGVNEYGIYHLLLRGLAVLAAQHEGGGGAVDAPKGGTVFTM